MVEPLIFDGNVKMTSNYCCSPTVNQQILLRNGQQRCLTSDGIIPPPQRREASGSISTVTQYMAIHIATQKDKITLISVTRSL